MSDDFGTVLAARNTNAGGIVRNNFTDEPCEQQQSYEHNQYDSRVVQEGFKHAVFHGLVPSSTFAR